LLGVVVPVTAASPPGLVKDINPKHSSNPSGLTQVGGVVFFAANDGVHGTELWKSDGTAAGTEMVKDIKPRSRSSQPRDLVNANGILFFTANDGTHGRTLWKSDGTEAGTVLVKNIRPDGSSGLRSGLTALGSLVFFFERDHVWVSDGTLAGTRSVYQAGADHRYPYTGVATASDFYFTTILGGTDLTAQLWRSTGTTAKRVPKIQGIDVGAMTAVGKTLYLAVDGDLWRTNGTFAGTRRLLNNPDAVSGPSLMHGLGHSLIFLNGLNGKQLWVSDGTTAGTNQIFDIGEQGLAGASMVIAGGQLFIARGGNLSGTMWRTNGTNLGTSPVGVGKYSATPRILTAVGGKLCFGVPDSFPYDFTWSLWETNGGSATEGTYSVGSFVLAWVGDMTASALGDELLFSGDDGVHGAELWSYTP